MALKMLDRASETTSTAGTGAVALNGAVAGFRTFRTSLQQSTGMADGDTTYYFINDPVELVWEVQFGAYVASTNSLTRPTPLASSNNGALVSFLGNAGTLVSSDIPAALMQTILASLGAIGSVTDGSTAVTNAATIDFTSGATVSNVGGVAAVAISAGTPLEVLGGGGTITNASTINFTSGGTVSSGGAGIANVAISGGGGGGSYASGLGIAFTGASPTTIGNTGTIVQPTNSGTTSGLGIIFQASNVASGNYSHSAHPGGMELYAGNAVSGVGGAFHLTSGKSEYSFGGGVYISGGNSTYGVSSYPNLNAGLSSLGKGGPAAVLGGTANYGPSGNVLLNADPSIMSETHTWQVGENPNGLTIFTATRPARVTAIIGRLNAANAGASTLSLVRAPSGTAVSAGTALHSGSLDANGGTLNANQVLALVANVASSTTLTFTGQPSDGQTVSFMSLKYTFKAALTGAQREVQIGATATASITNLVHAIMNSGTAGTDYSINNFRIPFLTAAMGAGSTATVTASYASVKNSGISTTTTVTGASFTGSHLAGGASTCDLAAGDSLGIQTTGTWALSQGSVTVHMTPQFP